MEDAKLKSFENLFGVFPLQSFNFSTFGSLTFCVGKYILGISKQL